MRKWMLPLTLAIGFCFSANAEWTMLDFFKAVAGSDVLLNVASESTPGGGTELVGIRRTMTYRCPGCYQFVADFEYFDERSGKVVTVSHSFATVLDLETDTIRVMKQAS